MVTAQPNCTTPTGTIVITAPTGPTIQYSVGGPYQSSSTSFTGLMPNNYQVTAQNTATGCISMPLSLTVDPVPAPPATNGFGYSTAQLHDPHRYYCHHCPYWTNYPIQCRRSLPSSTSFTGLMPNNCQVTAQNTATGCISMPLSLAVDPVPAPPATPTASVTAQPKCTTPTGTIVITAPTGPTIQYSVGGPYQSSTSFTGLMPNNCKLLPKIPQQVVSLCR
ncbi:MAG: hypothetical protein R2822_15115 [Spirosomataceae bacterium]